MNKYHHFLLTKRQIEIIVMALTFDLEENGEIASQKKLLKVFSDTLRDMS
jgi:hypothetical protein